MAPIELDNDLAAWSGVFKSDLLAHLADVYPDDKLCGFAVELPSDFGNDGLISRVGKRQIGDASIPSLDEWDYIPNGKTFDQSADELIGLYEKYVEQLDDETFYELFGNRLYSKILAVMLDVVSAGDYPRIQVWLLTLSDDEHPILDEAALALNVPAMQAIAQSLAH